MLLPLQYRERCIDPTTLPSTCPLLLTSSITRTSNRAPVSSSINRQRKYVKLYSTHLLLGTENRKTLISYVIAERFDFLFVGKLFKKKNASKPQVVCSIIKNEHKRKNNRRHNFTNLLSQIFNNRRLKRNWWATEGQRFNDSMDRRRLTISLH